MNALTSEDISYLLDTARLAGRDILDIYETDFEVTRKDDSSPLTEADLRAHRAISGRLGSRYPDVPVLSEESSEQADYSVRSRWSRFWLVDPLDGTKEFVKRNGQFTVNIALVEDGRPAAGVVYAPVKNWLYWGSTESGAFKQEGDEEAVQLHGPNKPGSDGLVIVGSLSHPTPEMDDFVKTQREKYGKVEFVAMGSSLKICLVAEGRAHVYPRFGPTMEWDTAAAHAVAAAAGCRVIDQPGGGELRYNKPDLHNGWFLVTRAGRS